MSRKIRTLTLKSKEEQELIDHRDHDPRPYIQRIRTKLGADESLRAVLNADNPRDAKVYKFNQVLDRLLLEFVHTKLDLYKKLTEPKVNEMLKRQWFEVLASGMSDEGAVHGR